MHEHYGVSCRRSIHEPYSPLSCLHCAVPLLQELFHVGRNVGICRRYVHNVAIIGREGPYALPPVAFELD